MCRKVEGSGSTRIVVYTVDGVFSTKKPGFVHRETRYGDIKFTDDIWHAKIWATRKDLDSELEYLERMAGKKSLLTHQATCQLTVPEIK